MHAGIHTHTHTRYTRISTHACITHGDMRGTTGAGEEREGSEKRIHALRRTSRGRQHRRKQQRPTRQETLACDGRPRVSGTPRRRGAAQTLRGGPSRGGGPLTRSRADGPGAPLRAKRQRGGAGGAVAPGVRAGRHLEGAAHRGPAQHRERGRGFEHGGGGFVSDASFVFWEPRPGHGGRGGAIGTEGRIGCGGGHRAPVHAAGRQRAPVQRALGQLLRPAAQSRGACQPWQSLPGARGARGSMRRARRAVASRKESRVTARRVRARGLRTHRRRKGRDARCRVRQRRPRRRRPLAATQAGLGSRH